MSEKNPDLEALQETLEAVQDQIRAKKGVTQDAETYKALNRELIELNHRITLIGGLIFRQQSNAIANAAKKVEASKADLIKEIKKIEKLTSFLKAISGFLGLVDKVIDLAKAGKPS